MKKILLLDADGVAFSGGKYFSTRYADEFGVPTESIIPFFKNEFRECQVGTKDLKEALRKYLALWQWKGSVDELLGYWFQDGGMPDTEVIEIVQSARSKGIQCYLATDQEKYRADYLWNTLGLAQSFDGSFFSCNLGAQKTDGEYWQKVLQSLGDVDPSDVEFWDDDEENVIAAKKAGIDAHFFVSIEDMRTKLDL